MYSKAAEDEDSKMVESWQKDADGILIFTGLFSAAVAALLAVSVQDLIPYSQDTTAFYLPFSCYPHGYPGYQPQDSAHGYDLICAIQNTPAHISQLQSVQVSTSCLGNASQQVLIEALPPMLVLHLNRISVRYNAAVGDITKIEKSIRFSPELGIPPNIMVPNAQRPSEIPHYKLKRRWRHRGSLTAHR